MLDSRFMSVAQPSDCDIYVGLITSDYQVRVRWGWMGFDNASWDASCVASLLYPHVRVDVDHKRGDTRTGCIIGIDAGVATDGMRIQADWTTPRPMNYVLAAFALPRHECAARRASAWYAANGRIGISIEHGGRKPRRTIGPYVTITDKPWNRDCWMMYDSIGRDIYTRGPMILPPSVRIMAQALLAAAHALPIAPTKALAAGVPPQARQ
jgi:hypothetical protein